MTNMDTPSELPPSETISTEPDSPAEIIPAAEPTAPKESRSSIVALLLLPILTFALGIGIGYLAWGKQAADPVIVASAVQATMTAQPTTAAAAAEQQAAGNMPAEPPQNVKRYDVPIDDDYVFGPADAPITIIEFSDFQCPYCRQWYTEVLQPLFEMYPGKIRFVYRDFPLTNIHPEAVPAAIAANCAGEQGKYYEYHNSLFGGAYGLGGDAYQKYAADLALDSEQFSACVKSEKYRDEIFADLEWASNLGVQSTPTFFLNGIPLVGAQPLETFKTVIDWELEGKIPKGY
jgi:protein-disulfide isomerase